MQKTDSLKIPKYLDEKVVLDTIETILNKLAPGFVFGYFDIDDIKSVGREIGIRALADYDPKRKLDGFLFVHIKRRLINFKRDNFKRNDPPCLMCHLATRDGLRTNHAGGEICKGYKGWAQRNNDRQNVMQPINLDKKFFIRNESQEPEVGTDYNVELQAQANELIETIDMKLPAELRETYLKMKDGHKVSNVEREKVKEFIRGLMDG